MGLFYSGSSSQHLDIAGSGNLSKFFSSIIPQILELHILLPDLIKVSSAIWELSGARREWGDWSVRGERWGPDPSRLVSQLCSHPNHSQQPLWILFENFIYMDKCWCSVMDKPLSRDFLPSSCWIQLNDILNLSRDFLIQKSSFHWLALTNFIEHDCKISYKVGDLSSTEAETASYDSHKCCKT